MTWIIVIAAALVLLHQAGGFRVGHRLQAPAAEGRGACRHVGGAAFRVSDA